MQSLPSTPATGRLIPDRHLTRKVLNSSLQTLIRTLKYTSQLRNSARQKDRFLQTTLDKLSQSNLLLAFTEIKQTVSEGFQEKKKKRNKGPTVNMLNEYLAFPHQSPVLVQIASVTRATHFDLALTIKKVFPQNAPRINRTWIHATVSLGSVGYLILHTKDSRDATSLRQTRKILLKNSSIHFFFLKDSLGPQQNCLPDASCLSHGVLAMRRPET